MNAWLADLSETNPIELVKRKKKKKEKCMCL